MERKKRSWVPPAVLTAIPLVLLGLYFVTAARKSRAELALITVIRPLRDLLGRVSSLLPFSLMELVYTGLGLGVLVYLLVTLVQLFRRENRLRRLLRRLGALALTALWLFCAFEWLWGLEYRTFSFSQRESFYSSGVTKEDLTETAEYFLRYTAAYADSVPRDENGCFAADMDDFLDEYNRVYAWMEHRFPSLRGAVHKPKKMYLYSEFMSRTGFTGVYFCFTGESNVNINQTAAFIPCTAAHELAHQKGVASEQACNFLGIVAGMSSGIAEYQYSCGLDGLVHLMNALTRADPDKWRELHAKLPDSLLADLNANDSYWAEKHSTVTKVSEKAYDTYLKANGQPLGIQSYGACVDLLVEFYRTDIRNA